MDMGPICSAFSMRGRARRKRPAINGDMITANANHSPPLRPRVFPATPTMAANSSHKTRGQAARKLPRPARRWEQRRSPIEAAGHSVFRSHSQVICENGNFEINACAHTRANRQSRTNRHRRMLAALQPECRRAFCLTYNSRTIRLQISNQDGARTGGLS
jgi:hypothetical protein